MKTRISSTEAARHLGECLARIKHAGERFVIVKNNKPVAELGPVAGADASTLRTLWEALRAESVDDGFADDLERVNRSDRVLENPWDSSSTPRP
jgi:antitoxin (DNA-binding transcriptional repressor) of toxin-antitoxin stability system